MANDESEELLLERRLAGGHPKYPLGGGWPGPAA